MEEEKSSSKQISDAAAEGTGSGALAVDPTNPRGYAETVAAVLFPMGTNFDDAQRKDLFEHYKLLSQNSEQMATRRQTVNSFFLSINTALIAANGVILKETFSQTTPHRAEVLGAAIFMLVLGTIGLVVCKNWGSLVKSYSQIMAANSMVAQQLEKYMLAAAITAQQTFHGKQFLSITLIERNVAHTFMAIYFITVSIAIYLLWMWHTMPPQFVIPGMHH